MKLSLLTVGKPTDPHYNALCEEYLRRIRHYIAVDWVAVRPLRIKSLSDDQIRLKEAELIRGRLAPQQQVVALDRSGVEYDTMQWAAWLQKRLHDSAKSMVFLIGGPLGLDRSLIAEAQQVLSLSRLTFAHELAAVILLEQLYRAFNLLHGGNYHK